MIGTSWRLKRRRDIKVLILRKLQGSSSFGGKIEHTPTTTCCTCSSILNTVVVKVFKEHGLALWPVWFVAHQALIVLVLAVVEAKPDRKMSRRAYSGPLFARLSDLEPHSSDICRCRCSLQKIVAYCVSHYVKQSPLHFHGMCHCPSVLIVIVSL